MTIKLLFFFSSRRRHTRLQGDWSSDVCSSDLVAVGSCISSTAGVFNIGQEGQVAIGALAGAWVALRLAINGPLLLILVALAAAVGGGVWAGVCAIMHRVRRVNVVVSTLLMTFVAAQVVSYAV